MYMKQKNSHSSGRQYVEDYLKVSLHGREFARVLEGFIGDLGFDIRSWGRQMSGKYFYSEFNFWVKSNLTGLKVLSLVIWDN